MNNQEHDVKLIAMFNADGEGNYTAGNKLAELILKLMKDEECYEEDLQVLVEMGICVEVGIPKYEYKTFKGGH